MTAPDGTVSRFGRDRYDGDELTLTLSHGSDGGWRVAQRVLSAGIDGALAGRYWTPDAGSPQSLFVLRDRQGTTLGAYRADGTPDPLSWYQPLGAFGAPAGDGSSTSGGKSSATATGFIGAGAPSASGGYVYLRNRWYDPATGRFLTQDPIGLAGGVNLYAYAGNDPVNFSDPFGLCDPPDSPVCRFIVGVARRVQPLQSLEQVMLAVASLPLMGTGEAAPVRLGIGAAGRAVGLATDAAVAGARLLEGSGRQIFEAGRLIGRQGLSQSQATSAAVRAVARLGYEMGPTVQLDGVNYVTAAARGGIIDAIAVHANGSTTRAALRLAEKGYELVKDLGTIAAPK